jgi:hypothetical protein
MIYNHAQDVNLYDFKSLFRMYDLGSHVLGRRNGLRRPQLARTIIRLNNPHNHTRVPVIIGFW